MKCKYCTIVLCLRHSQSLTHLDECLELAEERKSGQITIRFARHMSTYALLRIRPEVIIPLDLGFWWDDGNDGGALQVADEEE